MVVVVYTIPYGTIAGTRLPVIPPFETFLSFFGVYSPLETFVVFTLLPMELSPEFTLW